MAREPTTYSPRRAWWLAGLAFLSWWVAAVVVGAVAATSPLSVAFSIGDVPSSGAQLVVWYGLVTALIALVVCGYWFVWPIGTETHGRPLHRGWATGFGVAWGLSEAVLYITVWAVIRDLVGPDWLVVVASFLVIGGLTGVWHQRFWDLWVAPIHNIEEWNLRKVLMVHSPNLAVSLALLTLYESGLVVVIAQIIALVGAAIAMRFPSPRDRDTALDGSALSPGR